MKVLSKTLPTIPSPMYRGAQTPYAKPLAGAAGDANVRAQRAGRSSSLYPQSGESGETERGNHGSRRQVVVPHVGDLDLASLANDLRVGRRCAVGHVAGENVLAIAIADGATHVVPAVPSVLRSVAHQLADAELVVHDYSSLPSDLLSALAGHREVTDTEIGTRLAAAGALKLSAPIPLDLARASVLGVPPTHTIGTPLESAIQRAADVLELAAALDERFRNDGQSLVWWIERALTPLVVLMARHGIAVDRGGWEQLLVERQRTAGELAVAVKRSLGIQNPDDAEEVKVRLAKLGINIESSDAATLARFASRAGVCELVRLRSLNAFLRNIGKSVLAASAADGRIHPHWVQIAARTGRMSCREPALTGVERCPAVRSLFVPSPDHVFVIGDYPQVELRVAAAEFREASLLEAFQRGADPHAETAARITEKDLGAISETERSAAKVFNFGVLYGMQPEGLVENAWAEYGIQISVNAAREWIEAFRRAYPRIAAHHDAVRAAPPLLSSSRGGRLRSHNPEDSLGARLATPIQATVADMVKLAVVLAYEDLRHLDAHVVLVVHDEVVVDAPKAHDEAVRAVLREAMHTAFFRFVPELPSGVEPEIRTTWATESRAT